MLTSFILVFALCMDLFAAGIAYGTDHIQISHGKILLLNGICSLFLGLSLAFGICFGLLLPANAARLIQRGSFFCLGLFQICHHGIFTLKKRCHPKSCRYTLSLSGLEIIIQICRNPTAADADASHSLSVKEVLFLSAAMSLDCLTAGTVAALREIRPFFLIFLSMLVGTLLMETGLFLGKKIGNRLKESTHLFSGLLFFILAALK